jgi:hypothetical protein
LDFRLCRKDTEIVRISRKNGNICDDLREFR